MFTAAIPVNFVQAAINPAAVAAPATLGARSKLTLRYVPVASPPLPYEIRASSASPILSTACSGALEASCSGSSTSVTVSGKAGLLGGSEVEFSLDQAQMLYCPSPALVDVQVFSGGFPVERGQATLALSQKTRVAAAPAQDSFLSLADANFKLDLTLPVTLPQNSVLTLTFDPEVGLQASASSPCPIPQASSCSLAQSTLSLTFGAGPLAPTVLQLALKLKNPRAIGLYPVQLAARTAGGCEFLEGSANIEVKQVPSISGFVVVGTPNAGIFQTLKFDFVTGSAILPNDLLYISFPSSLALSSTISCAPVCQRVAQNTLSIPAAATGSLSVSYVYKSPTSGDESVSFELRDSKLRVVAQTSAVVSFTDRVYEATLVEAFNSFGSQGKAQKGEVKLSFRSKSYLDKGTKVRYNFDPSSFEALEMSKTASSLDSTATVDTSKKLLWVTLNEPLPADGAFNATFQGLNPSADSIKSDAISMVVLTAADLLVYQSTPITSPLNFFCGSNCAACKTFYLCTLCSSGFSLRSSGSCEVQGPVTPNNISDSSSLPPFIFIGLQMAVLLALCVSVYCLKKGANLWNIMAAFNSLYTLSTGVLVSGFVVGRNSRVGTVIILMLIAVLLVGSACGFWRGRKVSSKTAVFAGLLGMDWLRGRFGVLKVKEKPLWSCWGSDDWESIRSATNWFFLFRASVLLTISALSVFLLATSSSPRLLIVELLLLSTFDSLVHGAAAIELLRGRSAFMKNGKYSADGLAKPLTNLQAAKKLESPEEEDLDQEGNPKRSPSKRHGKAEQGKFDDASIASMNALLNLTIDVPQSIPSSQRADHLKRKTSENGLIVIEDLGDPKKPGGRFEDSPGVQPSSGRGPHKNTAHRNAQNRDLQESEVLLADEKTRQTGLPANGQKGPHPEAPGSKGGKAKITNSSPVIMKSKLPEQDGNEEFDEEEEEEDEEEQELNEYYDPHIGGLVKPKRKLRKRVTLSDGNRDSAGRLKQAKLEKLVDEQKRREKAAEEKKEEWLKKKKQAEPNHFRVEGEPSREDFEPGGLLYLPPDAPHTLLDPATGDFNPKSFLLHPLLHFPASKVAEVKQNILPASRPIDAKDLEAPREIHTPENAAPASFEPITIRSMKNHALQQGSLRKPAVSRHRPNFARGYWTDLTHDRRYVELLLEEAPDDPGAGRLVENPVYDNPLLEKSNRPLPRALLKKVRAELSNLLKERRLPVSKVVERAEQLGIPGLAEWKRLLRDSDEVSTDSLLQVRKLNGQDWSCIEQGLAKTKDGKTFDWNSQKPEDLKAGLFRDTGGQAYLLGLQDPLGLRKGLLRVTADLFVPLASQPSPSLAKGVVVAPDNEKKQTHVNGQTLKDHQGLVVRDAEGVSMNIRKQQALNIAKGRLQCDNEDTVELKAKQDKNTLMQGLYRDDAGALRRFADTRWSDMGKKLGPEGLLPALLRLPEQALLRELKSPLKQHLNRDPADGGRRTKKEKVGLNRTNRTDGQAKIVRPGGQSRRINQPIEPESLVVNLIANNDESFDLSLNIEAVDDDAIPEAVIEQDEWPDRGAETALQERLVSQRDKESLFDDRRNVEIGVWDATETFLRNTPRSKRESGADARLNDSRPAEASKFNSTMETAYNTMNHLGRIAQKNLHQSGQTVSQEKREDNFSHKQSTLKTVAFEAETEDPRPRPKRAGRQARSRDKDPGLDRDAKRARGRQGARPLHSSVERVTLGTEKDLRKMDHLKRIYVNSSCF